MVVETMKDAIFAGMKFWSGQTRLKRMRHVQGGWCRYKNAILRFLLVLSRWIYTIF